MKRAGAERVVVLTKQAYAPLFEATDGVDEVAAFDPSSGLRGLLALTSRFRGAGYTVIDAHNVTRSRIVSAALGGAASRFRKYYRQRLGMIVFKRHPEIPRILENYRRLATDAGMDVAPLTPGGLSITDLARARAAEHLPGDRWVGIAAGSRWPDKCWPAERYAALAQRIVAEMGARVALFGDDRERDASAVVAAAVPNASVDLTGELGLLDTAAHIARCEAFVGNDSGLSHLAEASGVPVITLFGPTVRGFGYPPALEESRLLETDLPCRPCSRNGSTPCIRGDRACMRRIEADQVFDALTSVLSGRRTQKGARDV